MAEKWYEIQVEVRGFEYYTVKAETPEDAYLYIRTEAPAPDTTEVDWDGDFLITSMWED